MAISIEDFRKSLNVGLSRDLVQKILTKYENFDFSSVTTDNGSKLREIDAIDKENDTLAIEIEFKHFLNTTLKKDYFVRRKMYDSTLELPKAEQRKIISNISDEIRKSLYSRPNTLTISSKVINDKPQKDESSHILTINTDSASIINIVNSLYYDLSRFDIPFDIEIPKFKNIDNGYTEAIKLHVTTMDLENTIKAIARLDKVYKDKIKKPNMFNANVQDIFGYDSVIDINGTRASDVLGIAIIKALDKTLVDLSKDDKFDNQTVAEYLRNAENKDEARKRIIQRVKTNYPNIIDPVLIETVNVIKEESLAIDPENLFISDMASSELNVEFGVMEEEITNVNEIEEEKEEVKTSNVIKEAASSVATDIKSGILSIHDLFANQYIQPAITFGGLALDKTEEETLTVEPSESLKVDNPTVTVIEPVQKEVEFNELTQPKFDSIDENVKPVFTAEEPVEAKVEDFVLPGEESFVEEVQPSITETEKGVKEVITPEIPVQEQVVTKEVTPIVIPSVESPIIVQPIESPIQPVEENVLPGEEPAQIDAIPEIPSLEEIQEQTSPVIEEAVGVSVIDDSEVEVQKATETQVISEPIVPVEEPVIKDDTESKLDETQILPIADVTKASQMATGIKEVITPEVNPVPVYNPADYVTTPEVKQEQTLQKEVEQKLTQLENVPVDTRTIEIPTDEIKEENDILSAISKNLEVSDSSKLSTEEKIAVVADSFAKPVDPVEQAKIDKYAGIFIDNKILKMPVKDTDENTIYKEDGTPYTFLDYLEDNDVLNKIQLDSKYYFKDNPSRDYVDGKSFIREYITTNGVNGNHSVEEILDWYIRSVTNINDQPKKKGFFAFGKK